MNRRFPIFALVTAFVFLCFLAGCWNPFAPDKDDKGGGGGQQELLPRTSPENVLFDLRIIYGDKDNLVNSDQDAHYWAENYRSLFHQAPDTFKFYFIPGQAPPDLQNDWWGINEEVYSFEMMLRARAAGEVDDIQLTWLINPSEPDNRLGHEGWRHISVNGILLDVIKGEITQRVSNGTAQFYFAPDPADSTLWVITEWWDEPPPEA